MIISLKAFDLQVMLRLGIAREAQFIGQLDVALHLFQKALIEVPALTGHSGLDLVSASHDTGLHEMKTHFPSPS
jgi:hypothetical protein